VKAVQPVAAKPGHVTASVRRVLLAIEAWRGDGIERVWPIFNHQLSTAQYEPSTRQLLPVNFTRFTALEREPGESRRLVAMQVAESNLAERSGELSAEFRRRRQDAITAELLEVVSGYEAAEGCRSDSCSRSRTAFADSANRRTPSLSSSAAT